MGKAARQFPTRRRSHGFRERTDLLPNLALRLVTSRSKARTGNHAMVTDHHARRIRPKVLCWCVARVGAIWQSHPQSKHLRPTSIPSFSADSEIAFEASE